MTILGIDVSAAQGFIDWQLVARSQTNADQPVSFAICKASEGNGYADPTFRANWLGIGATGMPRGAYHFAHPDTVHLNDAAEEANHFVSTVNRVSPFRPGVDFLALDIEEARGVAVGRAFTDWVLAFVQRVEGATGQRCVVYTGGPFFDEHDGAIDDATAAEIGKRPLWLAAYVKQPQHYVDVTREWRGRPCWLHQMSGDQSPAGVPILHVPGIGGGTRAVDRSAYPGTVADLRADIAALVLAHATDPAPPPFDPIDIGKHDTDWRPESATTALADLYAMDSREPDTQPETPTGKSSQSMRAVRLDSDNDPEPGAA